MLTGLSAKWLDFTVRFYQEKGFKMPVIKSVFGHIEESPINLELPEYPSCTETYMKLTTAIMTLRPLEEIQKMYAEYAIARHGNIIVHAAKTIKVNPRTLHRWRKSNRVNKTQQRRTRIVGP